MHHATWRILVCSVELGLQWCLLALRHSLALKGRKDHKERRRWEGERRGGEEGVEGEKGRGGDGERRGGEEGVERRRRGEGERRRWGEKRRGEREMRGEEEMERREREEEKKERDEKGKKGRRKGKGGGRGLTFSPILWDTLRIISVLEIQTPGGAPRHS